MAASLYTQALTDFQNGRFPEAQQAVSDYLAEIHERIHEYSLREHTENLYDVQVSVIVVSHRAWFSSCPAGAGLEAFFEQPGV